MTPSNAVGTVYLVGAGPGDPELLTRKAERLLRQTDVILHDRLVSPEILAIAGPRPRRVYVGKRCGDHHVPQRRTEELLVHFARQGLNVVRLKGGDPFIFGRGGEELDALRAAGIPAEVVPGVTAALGCAAAARIPLTHRHHARSVLFLTGQDRTGCTPSDWAAYTRRDRTLVMYMGLAPLAAFCRELCRRGLPPDWPVAVIAEGTTSHQREVRGTLADIAERVRDANLPSPALALIGKVVAGADSDLPAVAIRERQVASGVPLPID
ncbi:uroporphyrin-III C-methyltransferase [Natronocella acetinitrilica]|uniref:uroporphyrinogen-III C-methyltransferase n=1 Tax=Natronocella acetinitrilica TaxID=414046 RepID=A0AAE3KGL6_9GAMM|nr:uroporphyrinogen-III C-methyltransferase [Natronocella acetinitrilica]MCP1675337.1 uroporphyrin-III C-methyltransferase [Natronocella acetinitrilica]